MKKYLALNRRIEEFVTTFAAPEFEQYFVELRVLPAFRTVYLAPRRILYLHPVFRAELLSLRRCLVTAQEQTVGHLSEGRLGGKYIFSKERSL